jgi:hypothetical protein
MISLNPLVDINQRTLPMANPPPTNLPNYPEAVLAVDLAEYNGLRLEIATLITQQGQFLSMTVILLGLVIAALNSKLAPYLSQYASLIAIPFVIVGLLYADASARIVRAAHYIQGRLQPRLQTLAGPCLQWENYIRGRHPGKVLTELLEVLRWTIFVVPSVIFTAIGFDAEYQVVRYVAVLDVILNLVCLVVLFYVFKGLYKNV